MLARKKLPPSNGSPSFGASWLLQVLLLSAACKPEGGGRSAASVATPDDGYSLTAWNSWDDALNLPGELAKAPSRNEAPFEGGNIGKISRIAGPETAINLRLRSDNDDALPAFWRQWWYLQLKDLPKGREVTITVLGHGQKMFYLPVYSYDNVHWQHFREREVTRVEPDALRVKAKFKNATVWLARYQPYSYQTLQKFLQSIKKSPFVSLSSIGVTPEGRSIPFLTITDKKAKNAGKSRVVIHARTHPGEVASSFLLEGLVTYLLSENAEAKSLRKRLVIDILPMLNVDGVAAGNNRVNTRGINLEGKWGHLALDPLASDDEKAPTEVLLFHDALLKRLKDHIPVRVALNLHSSGGEPGDKTFFFPHFGTQEQGYSTAESSLWTKQVLFIDFLRTIHGSRWFNPLPREGHRDFLAKSVPESWWWRNFGSQVMALSIESTYGKAGDGERWIEPSDMRQLGVSLAKTLSRYDWQESQREKSERVKLAH